MVPAPGPMSQPEGRRLLLLAPVIGPDGYENGVLQVFFSILQFKFQGGLGEEVIRAKRFNVFQQYSAHPIMTDDWESTVKNSDLLQLSVLVTQQPPLQSADSPSPECPRCERSHKVVISDPGRNWATWYVCCPF